MNNKVFSIHDVMRVCLTSGEKWKLKKKDCKKKEERLVNKRLLFKVKCLLHLTL